MKITNFLKQVTSAMILNQNVIVKKEPHSEAIFILKNSSFFKKLCVVDCTNICVAVILNLKENLKEEIEGGTTFILDNVDLVPDNAKEHLLRTFGVSSPAVMLINDENFEIPVSLAERCVFVDFK